MNRILVIEDDKEINALVAKCLSDEGHEVEQAFDGLEAIKKISDEEFDLIILDRMIPYIDGEEVLKKLRKNSNIPVIILSAKIEESEKIEGLNMGADDYVTKPFKSGELVARVNAQLRRYKSFNSLSSKNEEISDIIKFSDIELDTNSYELIKSGKRIQLTLKEFELMKLFITNSGRVFTKNQLFEKIWGDDMIFDENTLMVHISRLRSKLEDADNKYIQTIWGIGYRFGGQK